MANWVPANDVGNLDLFPSSQFRPGSAPASLDIWGSVLSASHIKMFFIPCFLGHEPNRKHVFPLVRING